MRIKTADKDTSIDELAVLLSRSDIPDETRAWIAHEQRRLRRGLRGERQAEYEIEFHFGSRDDVATLHGLRLECRGRTAQIDHLIITRFLDVWICESKAYTGRVQINDYGEWEVFYGHKSFGIESPVLQTWNQMEVLADVLDRRTFRLPTFLGHAVRPRLNRAVLFSSDARILRPVGASAELASELKMVMKVERLYAMLEQTLRPQTSSDDRPEITAEALAAFALQIARHHAPHKTDWLAKFRIAPTTVPSSPVAPLAANAQLAPDNVVALETAACGECQVRLRRGEVRYCADRPSIFGGRLLCLKCQDLFRARVSS